ncbi:hypothetical protein LWI29_023388 [Acer saccharum]|uniref:Uncharacterized protein n=1 Tax=Acer saccharum TaxID=4024 RepID=A0AA39T8W1_ACESA|nr:hypothetical protein LWI29_023388 [Acer saccharum]
MAQIGSFARMESVFPYQSLHTTLDRPTSTTISSWVPPILIVSSSHTCRPPLSPSSAVLSPELSPCEGPTSTLQAASHQLTLPTTVTATEIMSPSSSSAAVQLGSPALPPPAGLVTPAAAAGSNILAFPQQPSPPLHVSVLPQQSSESGAPASVPSPQPLHSDPIIGEKHRPRNQTNRGQPNKNQTPYKAPKAETQQDYKTQKQSKPNQNRATDETTPTPKTQNLKEEPIAKQGREQHQNKHQSKGNEET